MRPGSITRIEEVRRTHARGRAGRRVVGPRFEQEHRRAGILGEARREDRARRARPDHDHIELVHSYAAPTSALYRPRGTRGPSGPPDLRLARRGDANSRLRERSRPTRRRASRAGPGRGRTACEQAAHVGLGGRVRHEQLLADLRVRQPARHGGEHLVLAVGERVEAGVALDRRPRPAPARTARSAGG